MNFWPFRRKPPETRAAGSGFTAEIIAARESYISGRRGLAELTATAQTCVSMWELGLAAADVEGAPQLDRRTMALMGRSLALRGEAVFLIRGDRLAPAADWDVRTRDGRPTAYRLSVSEAGGGHTETALAAEVLHVAIGADPAAPWLGAAPLRRASLTASMLHALEAALGEVFESAPLGSQIVPMPDLAPGEAETARSGFRGKRGAVVILEGIAHATAGGLHPNHARGPDGLSPDLSKSMTRETLAAAREGIAAAFGLVPAALNATTTGPVIRENQRHVAMWTLQPMAELIAEEARAKLGGAVMIDVMRPLQAFDSGLRARSVSALVRALAEAKEAGIDPAPLLRLVDWKDSIE